MFQLLIFIVHFKCLMKLSIPYKLNRLISLDLILPQVNCLTLCNLTEEDETHFVWCCEAFDSDRQGILRVVENFGYVF